MSSRTPLSDGAGLPVPEPALRSPSPGSFQEDAAVQLPSEKGVGPDETPTDTDSPGEVEFKEGGYGWLVLRGSRHPFPGLPTS